MEKEKLIIFNIEEAYSNFLHSTLRFYKNQSKLIDPENMFDEHSNRKELLQTLTNFCSNFKNNSNFFFEIFRNWMINNTDISQYINDQIETLFYFLNDIYEITTNEQLIIKWSEQYSDEDKYLKEKDVKNQYPKDLIKDENLLNKVTEIIENKTIQL